MRNKWLLIHGALGSAEEMKPLSRLSTEGLQFLTMDLMGHGKRQMAEQAFTFPLFAQDVLEFLENKDIEKVNVFGHSMGGYLGLYLARHHPEKIDRVITYGTKFEWSPMIAQKHIDGIEPSLLKERAPDFVEVLKERHHVAGWQSVVEKSRKLLENLGQHQDLSESDYPEITQNVKILLGSLDRMVTEDESREVANALPNASMSVVEGVGHSLRSVNPTQLLSYFDQKSY